MKLLILSIFIVLSTAKSNPSKKQIERKIEKLKDQLIDLDHSVDLLTTELEANPSIQESKLINLEV